MFLSELVEVLEVIVYRLLAFFVLLAGSNRSLVTLFTLCYRLSER